MNNYVTNIKLINEHSNISREISKFFTADHNVMLFEQIIMS